MNTITEPSQTPDNGCLNIPRPHSPLHLFSQRQAPSQELITKVKTRQHWNVYGPADDIDVLAHQAGAFIASNSDAKPETITEELHKFLTLARDDCPHSTQACWLIARMFKACDDYIVPRWHQDGCMFTCSCPITDKRGGGPTQVHSKYAITLLGPATRLLLPGKSLNNQLVAASLKMRSLYDVDRKKLADSFAGCEEVAVQTGQVIRFSWGQEDSPIHSEPDWSASDRVFVSVLFGAEEELRDMCEGRGEAYGFTK